MRTNRVLLSMLAGCVFLAGPALAQDKKAGAPPQMSAEEKALMEAFEKMAAVGENHKLLEYMLGDWTTVAKMWMQPGAPPMESPGTCSSRSTMGGRYVVSQYKGMMMGKPFEGLATTGYDNTTGKFVATWMDDMSTGIMLTKGSYDPAAKSFTYWSEGPDPMQPKVMVKVREVVKVVDKDKHLMEWYETRDGKEAKTMEITYTRKK